MDAGQQGHGSEDEADGAERAFEALRAEVVALRRGLELVYREMQQAGEQPAGAAAPDYSPTLGKMETALRAIAKRLEAVERQPAMQMTAASLQAEIGAAAQAAAKVLGGSAYGVIADVRHAAETLDGLVGCVRAQREQRAWLWTVGGCGAWVGVVLWIVLASFLPWGAGDWLASFPVSRGRGAWEAGEALLQRDSPPTWDKMVRLYQACGDQKTEACEAALVVRSMPPGPAQEETKALPAVPPSRPPPRSRTGQPVP